MSDAQVFMALFIAMVPGVLAYKLCTDLYKA
ncbi:photosystem I reaction center subunit XII [filamentous cyanobacterium LEGE 11480]|uniref:Photosystem I reaction center subunit XII n=1 Tax=Romeriopsis navalis LEGE 11480 TaxID=2777977 RepID=A0A928VTW5_9CYAN|nr:photosystem I reaction center subunit XII [Romeriopsis navalis]MBE9032981.1 photosystem I reaction center subunit XII [Romeriopsis navalis LEGE 11480]